MYIYIYIYIYTHFGQYMNLETQDSTVSMLRSSSHLARIQCFFESVFLFVLQFTLSKGSNFLYVLTQPSGKFARLFVLLAP
jgi:hypothetical protein